MLNAKKLLAPVITGVIVAFLFIAVEIISPTPNKFTSLSEGTASKASLSHSSPSLREVAHSTGESNKLSIHNPRPKTQSPKVSTQNSKESVQSSKETAQNSIKPTQNSKPKIQNSNKLTQHSKLKTHNSKPLNRKTDNMNVLFIGVDKGKLLACSVFSINYKDKYQAGAVFLPTYSKAPNYKYSFAQIYEKVGVEGLRQVIEKEMEIDIKLYYSIERELLRKLESYIDPIYINNEKIELYNLFTMAVSPQDEQILGALVRELLKPGVFFTKLPRLLIDATRYIKTDFKVTLPNLKFHYNNIVNLDSNNIKKVVLPVQRKISGSQTIHVLDPYHLRNTVYEITK